MVKHMVLLKGFGIGGFSVEQSGSICGKIIQQQVNTQGEMRKKCNRLELQAQLQINHL